MTEKIHAIDHFLSCVEKIRMQDPALSSLQAGLIASLELEIAADSRTFSRLLGIEHALVLREINALADLGRLQITQRNSRTLRTFFKAETDQDI